MRHGRTAKGLAWLIGILLTAACLLTNAGCGKKGPPVPPPLAESVRHVTGIPGAG
ncbi:MAG: hypothetical protein R6U50_12210 [Desulfobacterales bacterium]